MLLLDDSSPDAVAADEALPPSASRIHDVIVQAWPRLAGRVTFVAGGPDDVVIDANDVVVSCHAGSGRS